MSDDLLTKARVFLDHPFGSNEDRALDYAAAHAHAAIDAAETLRRIEAQLAERFNPPMPCPRCNDHGEYAIGGNPNDPDMATCDCQPAPDAPATPQEGEVWQHIDNEFQVKVTKGYRADPCGPVAGGGWFDADPPSDPCARYWFHPNLWRRVSPAPAPLTEREVTAEVQGVEPEGDAAFWRARAEKAEALAKEQEAFKYKERRRADEAEARVALMAPVVDAAVAALRTGTTAALYSATRVYQEATRDA